MSVRIEGLSSLRIKLDRLDESVPRTVRREVKRGALNVQNGAKRNATGRPGPRVQTGRLRNSIAHEIDADGLNATIGTNVEYAPYVELGTARSRPYPYLFPALEAERPAFYARLRSELRSAIREVSQ